jgi:outer membrane protein OmpA-like peptidoglycan-associated protein
MITIGILCSLPISAQIDVEQKTKDASINRADQRTDEGIDKGLDAVEDGVKSLFKKKPKKEAKQETEQSQSEDKEIPQEGQTNKEVVKAQAQPTLQSATKYDFVPGDKVLFYDDFSQDAIGDFPALWTTNGSGEVRTLNLFPGKWLYMNAKDKQYCIMKDLVLPDNYILEFDAVPTLTEEGGDRSGFYLSLYTGQGSEFMDDGLLPGTEGFHLDCKTDEWTASGYKEGSYLTEGNSAIAPIEIDKSNHVIIWIQKRRLRVYHKGQKTLDLPTLLPDQIKINRLRFSLWSEPGLSYISNLRITTAKPDMRSKLLTEGKIVSYGIYFDVNSDKVKAESYGTLKEIAQVLTENPTVKIKIVGHTDGDGDAAKNLDLSKRRAASVKTELSKTFAIDGARIETDGKGKTEPIAPNDTPANKSQNRRVEFIKL